ncbi:MAG: 2,3-bisphosphoglycerate-independent phosphoglycerate mutase [Rhodospirillales bacterium]|nr:2,3-bisphosphoglycerate-independent phosphoglycerate mutase [Rhodospirillales bacterium]MSP80842.1 2,3-bisphosphoglycerate-independent phosphoglycerate mutase [Rhodospirillales bacterium]
MSPPAAKPHPLRPRPVVLCVLDGWGERGPAADNAIALAKMPNWNRYLGAAPRARLDASALEVGLPEGQMGNSEVGHMSLGAGRVVMQELPRIGQAVKTGALARHPRLLEFIAALKKSGGVCHLMGLLSPGGVHAHQDHIAALAKIVAAADVPVAVHAFLDGRDTPPQSALDYLAGFEADLAGTNNVRVATVTGRYWAMDRDHRWERVEKAFFALAEGKGEKAETPRAAIEVAYGRGETDEFILPSVIGAYAGMKDGDGLLMANFRADRVREILAALAVPAFSAFARPRRPRFAALAGMTGYSAELDPLFPALFVTENLTRILGEVVADAGLKQLRIAETEKYAHVTFFLNGGREREFPGEERILVPSPRVATYDLQPEMAADEVTDRLVAAIASGRFDLIVVNYANGDMVGHTGILAAAIQAAETVDRCLGRIERAAIEAGGALLITADHGNCEQMLDPETGQPHTAHTLNRVPVILVNGPPGAGRLRDGRLSDVAPTVLELMGLAQPREMTGQSLLLAQPAAKAAARP